jgi:tetratricopeptide (TPR) repeat protein
MYRKQFFTFLVAVAVLVVGGLSAFGQTGALRGKVMLKQADGTSVPVPNAVIDVYRLDIPSKQENIKTNKRGEYNILGLFIAGKYVLSVSAPNASPKIKTNIKAGMDRDFEVILDPGDGRRYTMDEAKKLASGDADTGGGGDSGGSAPSESAADRAKREELERKNAEITAQNKKSEEINAIVSRTFKAGRTAMQAGKYDEAIAQYNEGLAADPEQYTLLSDKALALKDRGFNAYKESFKPGVDKATKDSMVEASKKDIKEAYESIKKSYDLIKATTPPADQGGQANYNANKLAILDIRAEVMRLYAVLVDNTQGDAAYAAIEEYVAAEPKPERKAQTELAGAEMLRLTGNWEKSTAVFKKILETDPDNVEALRGAGLALFGAPDESTYQEAVNFLQRFVDKAPDTHPDKADAKAIIEEMKRKDIKPQKATGGKRRS